MQPISGSVWGGSGKRGAAGEPASPAPCDVHAPFNLAYWMAATAAATSLSTLSGSGTKPIRSSSACPCGEAV